MKTKATGIAGIGLCQIFGVIFVVLKLCGVINWSWAWVLAPFWIPVVIFILLLALWIHILSGG